MKFSQNSACILATGIDNCWTYLEESKCEECESGFAVNEKFECSQFEDDWNCLRI